MTATLLTPDLRRILADLARRIGLLERRINSQAATVDESHEIVFSYAGALVAATTSPPARVWRGGNLTVVAVSLGTAGSTATTLTVKRNGATVDTVTIPTGAVIYNGEVFARFAADSDRLTLTVTTVGTGAANMTAAARFT